MDDPSNYLLLYCHSSWSLKFFKMTFFSVVQWKYRFLIQLHQTYFHVQSSRRHFFSPFFTICIMNHECTSDKVWLRHSSYTHQRTQSLQAISTESFFMIPQNTLNNTKPRNDVYRILNLVPYTTPTGYWTNCHTLPFSFLPTMCFWLSTILFPNIITIESQCVLPALLSQYVVPESPVP